MCEPAQEWLFASITEVLPGDSDTYNAAEMKQPEQLMLNLNIKQGKGQADIIRLLSLSNVEDGAFSTVELTPLWRMRSVRIGQKDIKGLNYAILDGVDIDILLLDLVSRFKVASCLCPGCRLAGWS